MVHPSYAGCWLTEPIANLVGLPVDQVCKIYPFLPLKQEIMRQTDPKTGQFSLRIDHLVLSISCSSIVLRFFPQQQAYNLFHEERYSYFINSYIPVGVIVQKSIHKCAQTCLSSVKTRQPRSYCLQKMFCFIA